ncbi:23S rRNA (uracil(1939)-C(5))-methyltransferase RlmD [bacterium]|nr:23S rRNA (uracil(1939)-C(5))-methyltransferase RlmD [bacterium]
MANSEDNRPAEGEEYRVKAEKMLFSETALGKIGNFSVFIPNACPGDVLRVRIKKVNKNYAFGEIVEIETPSEYRVKPFCPMANICGSCSWQHIAYSEQLKQKQIIVKDIMKKIGGIDTEVPMPVSTDSKTEYRCKVQYPLSQTKVSKRILAGYYKKNSHELVNIKFCPIQPDLINKITEYFREKAQELGLSAYEERTHRGLLRHIVFKYSKKTGEMLVVLCINDDKTSPELKTLAKMLAENFKEIVGICANFNTMKNNVIMSDRTETIVGRGFYYEEVNGKKFRISANSFFQVNPETAGKIFEYVKKEITKRIENPSILDAYSGVSTFGIMLSDITKEVVCVEEIKHATEDAKENVKINNCRNVEIISNDAGQEFKKFQKEGRQFDVIVVDPPRKGCSEESIKNIVKSAKHLIVYVSCDVSTLARDTKYITSNGFKLSSIQPFDMFPNTYHIENVAVFERK